MIKFLYANTPNVLKVMILFKELNLKYELIPINIMKGVNKYSEFTKNFPSGKVPAVIDGDLKLYESVSIMLHYANQYSKFNFSNTPYDLSRMISFMIWVESDMLASLSMQYIVNNSFVGNDSMLDILDLLRSRVNNNLSIVEDILKNNTYIINNTYSLADMQLFSLVNALHKKSPLDDNKYPSIIKWIDIISKREAVINAYEELKDFNYDVALSEIELVTKINQ